MCMSARQCCSGRSALRLSGKDGASCGTAAIKMPSWAASGCDAAGADTGAMVSRAGLFHLHGLAVLCWDERPVRLAGSDDEELWRLMFRRSGMGRLEFKQALKLGRCSPRTCCRLPLHASVPTTAGCEFPQYLANSLQRYLNQRTQELYTQQCFTSWQATQIQMQLGGRAGLPVLCHAALAAGHFCQRCA